MQCINSENYVSGLDGNFPDEVRHLDIVDSGHSVETLIFYFVYSLSSKHYL